MPTPAQVQRLIYDEQDVEARKLQYAAELEARGKNAFSGANWRRLSHGLLSTVLALSEHEKRNYNVVKGLPRPILIESVGLTSVTRSARSSIAHAGATTEPCSASTGPGFRIPCPVAISDNPITCGLVCSLCAQRGGTVSRGIGGARWSF